MVEDGVDGARGPQHVEVLRVLDSGDPKAAATMLLRQLGGELFAYLSSQHRSDDEAREVFALAAEALWKGLASFRRESSLRTWAYAVTRGVSLHYRRDERRHRSRFKLGEWAPLLDEVEAKTRTETSSFLRTERRDRLSALRDALTVEERELLMLRIDRQLPWNELAMILLAPGEPVPEAAELKRRAARLRQRFQAIKTRLRQAAKRDGLQESRDVT